MKNLVFPFFRRWLLATVFLLSGLLRPAQAQLSTADIPDPLYVHTDWGSAHEVDKQLDLILGAAVGEYMQGIKDYEIAFTDVLIDKLKDELVTEKSAEVKRLTGVKQTAVANRLKNRTLGLMDTDGDKEIGFTEILAAMFSFSKSSQFASDMVSYTIQTWADQFLSLIGEVLYMVAFVLLKFLVSFFILVMLLTGPITIGLATFEWFYSGLASWVGRLLNLLMWIPITNLLAGMLESLHVEMLKRDIANLADPNNSAFTADNFSLVVFYAIGTVAYMTVPMTAGWIVEASGAGDAISRTLKGAQAGGGAVGGGVGVTAGAGAAGVGRIRNAATSLRSLTAPTNRV